jgi:polysaccharide chain length determinant protein (PEP-CTERM system associated)
MNPILEDVVEQARGAWRHRRLAVIAAWAAAVIGWVVVFLLPNSYEANARVFVSTSTALKPLLEGIAVEQDVNSQLNLVRESLLGRPRLERVAREADLDLKADTPIAQERVIRGLQRDIAITSQAPRAMRDDERKTEDSVYTISYTHGDREKALTVVRSLLNSLMEDTMSGRREGSTTAQKFLREQIQQYERRLGEAEQRLVAFKQKNVGLVPGEQGDFFSRLQNEVLAAKKVEADLQVAQRRRATLAAQLRGEQPFTTGMSGMSMLPSSGGGGTLGGGRGGGVDTASRLADSQARLDELLLRYTDRHPDVLSLRETIEQLKARQKAEMAALKRGDASAAAASGLAANPVYQSLQFQLNQVDVEISALRGQLDAHSRSEAELRRQANVAPEVEAEYARLTRDYNVERAQYTALVERLEKARLTDDAAGTGIVNFEIINPPTSDMQPKAPNRPLLIIAVFLGALLVGAAVAWLMSRLRPVYTSTRSLAEETGLPVLGSVTRTWADRHAVENRQGLMRLAGAVGGLAALFVVVLLIAVTRAGPGAWQALVGA